MSEKSNKELIAEAISKLSDEQKALMYPPLVKREYWSQSTDMPSTVKHLGKRELIN